MRRNKLDSEEQLLLAQEINPDEVYTAREAADMLHIHPSKLQRAMGEKKINAEKKVKSYEIPGTELIKFNKRLSIRKNKNYTFEELQCLIPEIDKQHLEEKLRERGFPPERKIPRKTALNVYDLVTYGKSNLEDWSPQDQESLDRLLQNPSLGTPIKEILNLNGNYTRNILAYLGAGNDNRILKEDIISLHFFVKTHGDDEREKLFIGLEYIRNISETPDTYGIRCSNVLKIASRTIKDGKVKHAFLDQLTEVHDEEGYDKIIREYFPLSE